MIATHQRINQDSGDVEYYTHLPIVDAARRTMGGINLDPFSSAIANLRVRADRFFTKEENGFNQDWSCVGVVNPDIDRPCLIEIKSTHGLVIETTPSIVVAVLNGAEDAKLKNQEPLNSSERREPLATAFRIGVSDAMQIAPETPPDSLDQQREGLKSTDSSKPDTENPALEFCIKESACFWITRLGERASCLNPSHGLGRIGRHALPPLVANALTVQVSKELVQIITSLYPTRSAQERFVKISFQPALDATHRNVTDRLLNGAKIQTPLTASGSILIHSPSKVFVNHPFGRDENPRAVAKMELEFKSGRAEQICAITFAATSEKWFQPLLRRPQCFLIPRTNYYMPDGTLKRGVTKGSVVTYFGQNVAAFCQEFAALGVVKLAA